MRKRTKKQMYVIVFVITFVISTLIRISLLGSAPERLIQVIWNDDIGKIYKNLDYENANGNQYDLYVPAGLDKSKNQYLIVFIHGGSFNSGSKEDGEAWCKYYASKGYVTASLDYTLQKQGKDASIYLMNTEAENAIKAIKEKTDEMGYHISAMAPCGVSAGGTLAMNLAYNGNSIIPVKFVFQMSAPTYFKPSEWSLLMKVDKLDSEKAFCQMMTGKDIDNYNDDIKAISPACIVNKNRVPSLIGYGLKDHCVPLDQKYYLMDAYNMYNVPYDYIEFPKSNHGMYNDLDKLQEFLDKSIEYADRYFQ